MVRPNVGRIVTCTHGDYANINTIDMHTYAICIGWATDTRHWAVYSAMTVRCLDTQSLFLLCVFSGLVACWFWKSVGTCNMRRVQRAKHISVDDNRLSNSATYRNTNLKTDPNGIIGTLLEVSPKLTKPHLQFTYWYSVQHCLFLIWSYYYYINGVRIWEYMLHVACALQFSHLINVGVENRCFG